MPGASIFLHVLHCTACPVSHLTDLPYVKMKPQHTEMKLVLTWLVSDNTCLLPGGLDLLHKVFTECCVGYNIWVKY